MDSRADPASDEELVRRFVEGDREAFAALVRRHERRVYNLAYRMLGREEDARDAAQEAFLSALRKLSSFREEAAFTTWMHRVTVNACYDVLRKRQREPLLQVAQDEEGEREPREPRAPGDHAEEVATALDVQRALTAVPAEFRVVLVLCDVQDRPQEEVAETLGIPIGTVKSRLFRGRTALARALGLDRRAGRGQEPHGAMPPSQETIP